MLSIPINDALKIWEEQRQKFLKPVDIHPDPHQIYLFSQGKLPDQKEKFISHFFVCKTCRESWVQGMKEETYFIPDEYYDVAYLKVAASEDDIIGDFLELETKNHQFSITFSKNLHKENVYILTLNVLDNNIECSGQHFEIIDKNDNLLLKGILSRREISGWVQQGNNIDPTEIKVRISETNNSGENNV